jgi:hypothetical protein
VVFNQGIGRFWFGCALRFVLGWAACGGESVGKTRFFVSMVRQTPRMQSRVSPLVVLGVASLRSAGDQTETIAFVSRLT